MKEYLVRHAVTPLALAAGWDDPEWSLASTLEIAEFRPEGSDHRPRTRARLVHSVAGLHGIFHVEDRFVACRHRCFQDLVYEDSCVELFLQPRPGGGYFNFEMNCGGALLATWVTDHRREKGQPPRGRTALRAEEGRRVAIRSTLPPIVLPEVETPLEWQLAFFVPWPLVEAYAGPVAREGGEWRANLYKCGDLTSHPHWASWSPVDALNFHLPHCFGLLRFAPRL